MKKKLLVTLTMAFATFCSWSQTATVSLSTTKQSIRGFGGMNLPEWGVDLTAAQRETAFGNGQNQLGLSILRIFVSDKSSDWTRAVATAKAAQEKGVMVFASPWNPPSTLTEAFTKSGDADAKRLKYDSYGAYAQHLIDYVTYMKAQGVKLEAISIQNEPDYGYDWTWWTATEMYNFVKNNVPTIRTAHPDVKIIAAESFGYNKSMTDPILNDNAVAPNIDVLGVHTYGVSNPTAYPLLKSKTGKEFWMTEVYTPNSDKNSADRWPEALEVGHHIHKCLVDAEMNAYVWWYIRREYSPMKEDGTISKRGACMAQFSKFVRPGYVRVDVPQNPTTDVYVSAYKKGDSVTVVTINKSTSAKIVTISVPGCKALSWQRYLTTATMNVEKGTDLYTKTSFAAVLPAQSMVTYVSVNTPSLKSMTPENQSFDLTAAMDSFQFVYTAPVNCSLVKATMSNGTQTFDLAVQQTGFADTLLFKIPANTTLSNGDYTITVSGVETETGVKASANTTLQVTYGLSQAGSIETVLAAQDSWKAQQSTVGEGVPLGWKRVQGSTNIDVDGNGAAGTGASRMKYFAAGGDMEAGFYFSARSEDLCRLTYGEYDGYKVHLKPGDYRITFCSAYWDAASQTAATTFDFYVKDGTTTVFSKSSLPSSLNLNSTAGIVVSGAQKHDITFSIATEKDYILQWEIAKGWNAVVLGNIRLETASTFAMQIKDKLTKAITNAKNYYNQTDTDRYRGTVREALLSTANSYLSFASTAPSAYYQAIATIDAATAALQSHIGKVDTYIAAANDAKTKSVRYNTVDNAAALPELNNYIQTASTYGNLTNYDNETELAAAVTALTTSATRLQSQIDILKARINKSLTVAKSLKVPVPASALTDAEATIIDDDQIANSLNAKLRQYVESNIAAGTLIFKADTTGTVANSVDSLDLTGYIKNPNFYTRSKTATFTNGAFPGWNNTTFTGQSDAVMQPLATDANPLVDSWVSFLNVQVDYFEQTLTNLPAGTYDIGFRTRRASGTVTQQDLLNYVHMYASDGTQTYKQPLTVVADRALPATPNTWIRNVKVASGGNLTLGIKFIPISGYSPTVFFGDPVLFMVSKNKDAVYTGTADPVLLDNTVKEVQYYTLTGVRLSKPAKGLNVVRTIYQSGRVTVQKWMNNF
jgi:O-glycosyl hydrolase